MTPTEDDYANGMTFAREYEPGTCCMAIVIILGEGCRALNGSNASKWHKSRLQTFLSLQALQACLRHCYKS